MQEPASSEELPVSVSARRSSEQYNLVTNVFLNCSFERDHEQALPPPERRLSCAMEIRRRSRIPGLRRSSSQDSGKGTRYSCSLLEDEIGMVEDNGRESSMPYEDILNLWRPSPASSNSRFDRTRLKITVHYGSYHVQLSSQAEREAWYYSLNYRRTAKNCLYILKGSRTPEETVKNMQKMADYYWRTPLKDSEIKKKPLEYIAEHLKDTSFSGEELKGIVPSLAQILGDQRPDYVISHFLSRHMRDDGFAAEVETHLGDTIFNVFKQGNLPGEQHLQELQMCWLQMLHRRHGDAGVKAFIRRLHGGRGFGDCPFPQVFMNIFKLVEMGCYAPFDENCGVLKKLSDYFAVLQAVTDVLFEYDDWKLRLAQELRSVPFPERALADKDFGVWMSTVVQKMASDQRGDIRLCLLPSKFGRTGWLQHFRIGSELYDDGGEVFAMLLKSLCEVEGHQKEVLRSLAGLLDSCLTVARQGRYAALEALERMAANKLVEDELELEKIAEVLRSSGETNLYNRFSQRDSTDETDGPDEFLKLEGGATTADLRDALAHHSSCLSVVDLQGTKCGLEAARMLSSFPNIKSMNWWSTPIDDDGVRILSDKLNLESLDLRDTRISDAAVRSLATMTNLRSLQLDSNNITRRAVNNLVRQLPRLGPLNLRYVEESEL